MGEQKTVTGKLSIKLPEEPIKNGPNAGGTFLKCEVGEGKGSQKFSLFEPDHKKTVTALAGKYVEVTYETRPNPKSKFPYKDFLNVKEVAEPATPAPAATAQAGEDPESGGWEDPRRKRGSITSQTAAYIAADFVKLETEHGYLAIQRLAERAMEWVDFWKAIVREEAAVPLPSILTGGAVAQAPAVQQPESEPTAAESKAQPQADPPVTHMDKALNGLGAAAATLVTPSAKDVPYTDQQKKEWNDFLQMRGVLGYSAGDVNAIITKYTSSKDAGEYLVNSGRNIAALIKLMVDETKRPDGQKPSLKPRVASGAQR